MVNFACMVCMTILRKTCLDLAPLGLVAGVRSSSRLIDKCRFNMFIKFKRSVSFQKPVPVSVEVTAHIEFYQDNLGAQIIL